MSCLCLIFLSFFLFLDGIEDPCRDYIELNESWRNRNSGGKYYCDARRAWHGWFRFVGAAGNKMANSVGKKVLQFSYMLHFLKFEG